jgi:hypothetical protein
MSSSRYFPHIFLHRWDSGLRFYRVAWRDRVDGVILPPDTHRVGKDMRRSADARKAHDFAADLNARMKPQHPGFNCQGQVRVYP